MPNHIEQIAAVLGLTSEQAVDYCNTVRAVLSVTQAPRNVDIARAVQELGRLSAALSKVAERAQLIAVARRTASRGNSRGIARVDRLRMQGKRPTAFVRCRSCGRPAIPGSDVCYTCS